MIKRFISLLLTSAVIFGSYFSAFIPATRRLRIIVPENWEMSVGDGRTLDYIFPEGVKNRVLKWSASPESVAVVDEWGRVTATGVGQAVVTAEAGGLKAVAELNVAASPSLTAEHKARVDFKGKSTQEVGNLQKFVDRYPNSSASIPSFVSSVSSYEEHQRAVTADGAVWEITDYGVLRTDKNAASQRDIEQRFMGDRYFYSADTTDGKVLAIFPDGENGIWTKMQAGVTHISMRKMSGTQKAEIMSADTQAFVDRRGMVSEAYNWGSGWRPTEDDNDGLWTSMYGAGELMRYAALRDDPDASPQQIETARLAATRASEAVLLLYYISMRDGTTEAYVRRQLNGTLHGSTETRWLSAQALEEGGDPSASVPSRNPSRLFNEAYSKYFFTGSTELLTGTGNYQVFSPDSWSDPSDEENAGVTYAKRTRLLRGFAARTYSLVRENNSTYGNIYWSINADKTATGVSAKTESSSEYLLNGENLRGVKVDASREIPQRLWNSLIGSEYTADDIIYKGDTSADELIGHMFLFKLMYDVLAPEDAELKQILTEAIDSLAKHLADNSYMLVDGTGQPTTWSNFSRECFSAASTLAAAPLHAMVVLCIFKTAAYITGYQKWEDEYRMAALDSAYKYAEIAAQYQDRGRAILYYFVGEEISPYLSPVLKLMGDNDLTETIFRLALNYSDEEMAMLAFYLMFQLESDKKLLGYYRDAIDQWWVSIQYSENPLWYYIYQLAYPDKEIRDAYGNNIVKTAAWSLSRHPVSTIRYSASNSKRDDLSTFSVSDLGLDFKPELSYDASSGELPALPENPETIDIVKYLLKVIKLKWKVAAPDERPLHKYNNNFYSLETHYNPNCKEASTTYTLPYWMGKYHNLLVG